MFCNAKIYGTGLWNFQYMSRKYKKTKREIPTHEEKVLQKVFLWAF